VEAAVQFYRELSDAFPKVAIMVYANMRAFRFSFPDEFWQAVIQVAPTVVSAKYAQPRDLRKLIRITEGRVNIVPNEMSMARFFEESPETTICCWATAASMGPKPTIALMRAVERRDSEVVKRISAALDWANEPILPIISNPEIFAQFNIQMEKYRINAAGYCNAGPVRSPYAAMPEDFAEFSRECGRRWAVLNREMAAGRRLEDFSARAA
jgi:dihydrodipicolinate synthase/N-acetylneuraminate lyase